MDIIETVALSYSQKEGIVRLWNNEYPAKLIHSNVTSFDYYFEKLSDPYHFMLKDDNDDIVGWAFSFIREEERWFALLIDGILQGKGFGSRLLKRLKQKEPILNGWVIDGNEDIKLNGELYQSPLKFYEQHGFIVHPETRLETKKISAVKISWKRENQ